MEDQDQDATLTPASTSDTRPLVDGDQQQATSRRRCTGCCCCQTIALALLTACVVIVVLAAVSVIAALSIIGYPWHASCKADWTFDKDCAEVRRAIIDQMNTWSGPDGCANGGEKCMYKYETTLPDGTVTGTHTTPVKHYVDDLRFSFANASAASNATCAMHGYSRSETWYAYLDDGTNYCNLKNLITGSGLDHDDPAYSERTSDSQCTQYSVANCDTY